MLPILNSTRRLRPHRERGADRCGVAEKRGIALGISVAVAIREWLITTSNGCMLTHTAEAGAGAMMGRAGVAQQRQLLVAAGPLLSDVLKPDYLAPLLQSEGVYDRLTEHLPEPDRNPHTMHELARSVHLQTQVHLPVVSAC